MNNEQREIADICVYEKNWPTFLAFCFQLFFKRAIRNSLRKIFKSDRIRSWKEERRERNIFYKNILISIYRSLKMQITFLTAHPAKMFPNRQTERNINLYILSSERAWKMFLDNAKQGKILIDDKNNRETCQESGKNAASPLVACCHISRPWISSPDSPKRMIFEISHFSYNTAVVINRGNNGGEREKKKQKKRSNGIVRMKNLARNRCVFREAIAFLETIE